VRSDLFHRQDVQRLAGFSHKLELYACFIVTLHTVSKFVFIKKLAVQLVDHPWFGIVLTGIIL
jgi:hypothetical protein